MIMKKIIAKIRLGMELDFKDIYFINSILGKSVVQFKLELEV